MCFVFEGDFVGVGVFEFVDGVGDGGREGGYFLGVDDGEGSRDNGVIVVGRGEFGFFFIVGVVVLVGELDFFGICFGVGGEGNMFDGVVYDGIFVD